MIRQVRCTKIGIRYEMYVSSTSAATGVLDVSTPKRVMVLPCYQNCMSVMRFYYRFLDGRPSRLNTTYIPEVCSKYASPYHTYHRFAFFMDHIPGLRLWMSHSPTPRSVGAVHCVVPAICPGLVLPPQVAGHTLRPWSYTRLRFGRRPSQTRKM